MPTSWKYKMILWDFDGTLACSKDDVWTSLAHAARQFGSVLPEEYTNDSRHLADPIGVIFRQLVPFPGVLREEEFENLVATHYRHHNGYAHTSLYPGLHQLLEELRAAGILNHIVTMKPEDALVRILHTKRWRELFTGWDTVDSNVGVKRDKSLIVADALARYQIAREDCVVVGDSVNDAEAALEHGIDFVAVTYGDGDTEQLLLRRRVGSAASTSDLRFLLERN